MKQRELTGLLCFAWAVTLLYGEMFAFWVPYLWSCSWPHHRLLSSRSGMDQVGENDYSRIAVIADPQLMDKTSLGLPPKSLALETAQFYTDLYMRRAYLGSIQRFKPDAVIFLGDYFDGGPFLSDEEWQDSLHRLKHMFDLKDQGRHADFPVYYIPGNHDIGYAVLHSLKPQVVSRYESEFGSRNHKFRVGSVDFIAVDAQTLDASAPGKRSSLSWDLVRNVSSDSHSNHRVLLTHIPLYRPDGTHCGPHRKSPIIKQRIQRAVQDQVVMFQNYVTQESSKALLDLIKPVLVLSGHDHDQCVVKHKYNSGTVEEITLGTTYTYMWYIALFVLTLAALLFCPTSGTSLWDQVAAAISSCRQILSSNLFGEGRKEKTDDEDCEYEEIWDAEGFMHLMKKSSNRPRARPTDTPSVERGAAVVRPTARKLNQEAESSMHLDISIEGGSPVKTAPKPSRSVCSVVIHRLVRTLRSLTVIAAVNVPLYMMLLFKDWNDQ